MRFMNWLREKGHKDSQSAVRDKLIPKLRIPKSSQTSKFPGNFWINKDFQNSCYRLTCVPSKMLPLGRLVKMRLKGWDLIQYDYCPYKKVELGYRDTHRRMPREDEGRHQNNASTIQEMPKDCQQTTRSYELGIGYIFSLPGLRTLVTPSPSTSSLQFWDNKCLKFLKPFTLWCCIMAAPAN